MTDSIVILPARLEWAESFRKCLHTVALEKKYFLMTEAPSVEKVRDFVLKINTAGHPHFFAMKASRVVGWCNVKRIEGPSRGHCGELSLGIEAGFRGRGLGKKLMEAALRESRLQNFHKIELTVFTDNKSAIQLYESFGFEIEGHLKDYAFLNGCYKDAFLMAQILD